MELQAKLSEIQAKGLGVAAISYDSPQVLKNFAERKGITFPLLSDEGSKVIRAFGILNEEVPPGMFAGIPYPGTYILDAKGVVVTKYFEEDYTQRYTASEILVREYGVAAASSHNVVETKHLKLASSASTDVVRSGQRIALTLDIDLKPGMHVYAPGVEGGYIAIDWKLNPTEAVIAHDLVAPQSKMLRLEAINETVPVYAGQFRLVRDITIAKDNKLKPLLSNGELTIEGTFKYQACDDRMCYVPQTVPLKWTLRVENHDRERVPEALRRKTN